jgi:HK97 family phage prohead protease
MTERAAWSASYINDLPDSAFACISPGGEKDEDGKTTPRSLRHYPHHDAGGKLDLPHLRAALARISDPDNEQCGAGHLADHAKEADVGEDSQPLTMETRLAIDAWRDIDFRLTADEDGRTFSGYAAVFDTESEDLGGFRETIAPGAFKTSVGQRKNDIKAFVNHDWGRLLATRKAKTLHLREDAYGLHVEMQLPDTQDGRDVAALTARGDIHAMSFGFKPIDTEVLDGGRVQRLREVRLFEVSPVTAWPAYRATSASVRHLAELVSVEEDEMAAAFRALTAADGVLTPEQRELLERAIVARSPVPLTTPLRDAAAERLAVMASR